MSRFATTAASFFAALLLPAIANAAPVTVQDDANDNGGSVFYQGLGRTIVINLDGSENSVGAGAFGLQYGSDADGYTNFISFCLQIHETLTLPKDHEREDGADYFADFADREALGIIYNDLLIGGFSLANATTAAATQAIIWEIAEDGASAFNLSAGSFQLLSQDVLDTANSLWGIITSGQFGGGSFNVFVADGTQDLLTSAVPIPGAIPLLISGLAGLSFATRRQKQH